MTIITTAHLLLTAPVKDDLPAIADFFLRNKDHLAPWENPFTPTEEILENWIKENEEGRSFRLLMRLRNNPETIIGFCNFTQIYRGPFQACYLGYKIDYQFQGKQLMYESLQAAIEFVFRSLRLHRIMANYMPANTRSAALLRKMGFVIEGRAKNYLLINGKWEDHVLTSLTNDQGLS